MTMRLDISQKKLYEKLVILEKYCIKLEKRIAVLESDDGEKKTSSKKISSKSKSVTTSTQTTNQSKKQTKKVKKLFDKYKMNPVNI